MACYSKIRVARSKKTNKKKYSKMIKGWRKAKFSSQICCNDWYLEFIKYFKFCSDLIRLASKCTSIFNYQKRFRNSQKVKPFYFWQTVSKRPNGNPRKKIHPPTYVLINFMFWFCHWQVLTLNLKNSVIMNSSGLAKFASYNQGLLKPCWFML